MTVYKRPGSKFYHYDFEIEGRRYRGSTKRSNRREAQQVEEAERRKALDRIQLGVRPELTLGDAMDRYLSTIKHQADYKKQVQRAKKVFGHGYDRKERKPIKRWGLDRGMMLHELSNHHISSLISARLEEGNKPRTINLELALLSRLVNVAQSQWEVRVNPGLTFKDKRFKTKNLNKMLTPDEEEALLRELDPTRNRPGLAPYGYRSEELQRSLQDAYDFTVCLLDTGMRHDELARLPWHRVSLNEGLITVYRWKVDNESFIGMTFRVRNILTRRYNERRGPYVFSDRSGKEPRPYHTARAITAAMDRAGINTPEKVAVYGRRTVHSFRDTFASRLVQRNFALYRVQGLLGHSSPSMTMKYAGLERRDDAEDAARVLDAALEQRKDDTRGAHQSLSG